MKIRSNSQQEERNEPQGPVVSNKYKHEWKELREQIALLDRNLATTTVDPSAIEAIIACNLIQLDKNPGGRSL